MGKRPTLDDGPAPAQVRAVQTFVVGVRTIHAGEVFPATDPAVAAVPTMFTAVDVEGEG